MVKPVIYSTCYRCGHVGHQASDELCPAKAPDKVKESTEAFRGCKLPVQFACVSP